VLDVVLDLQLDDWLSRECAAATAVALARVHHATQTCNAVRRAYEHGDAAHERGDHERAETYWELARRLQTRVRQGELVQGEVVT
jgi:hypothetical protein